MQTDYFMAQTSPTRRKRNKLGVSSKLEAILLEQSVSHFLSSADLAIFAIYPLDSHVFYELMKGNNSFSKIVDLILSSGKAKAYCLLKTLHRNWKQVR